MVFSETQTNQVLIRLGYNHLDYDHLDFFFLIRKGIWKWTKLSRLWLTKHVCPYGEILGHRYEWGVACYNVVGSGLCYIAGREPFQAITCYIWSEMPKVGTSVETERRLVFPSVGGWTKKRSAAGKVFVFEVLEVFQNWVSWWLHNFMNIQKHWIVQCEWICSMVYKYIYTLMYIHIHVQTFKARWGFPSFLWHRVLSFIVTLPWVFWCLRGWLRGSILVTLLGASHTGSVWRCCILHTLLDVACIAAVS